MLLLALVAVLSSLLPTPAYAHGTPPAASDKLSRPSAYFGASMADPRIDFSPTTRDGLQPGGLWFDEFIVGNCCDGTFTNSQWQFKLEKSSGAACDVRFGDWSQLDNSTGRFNTAEPVHKFFHLNYEPLYPGIFTSCPNASIRLWAPSTGRVFVVATDENVKPGPAAPTGVSILSTSPGGKTLTWDMVAALALNAGFSPTEATMATAVARAESSFRTKAISYTGCCHGLWQVNSAVHGTTAEAMFDPVQNAAKAFSIYVAAGRSWQPWEAYTLGMHSQYLAEASAAVDRQVASNMQALYSISQAPVNESGSVTIGWTTSCANCTHTVQRATATTGPWTTLGTTTNLSFVDRAATASTTYYYRVKSSNADGESPYSDPPTGVTTGAADPSGGIPSNYQGENGLASVGANDPDAGKTDDGKDVSCSWWNLFCHLKSWAMWAFKPGESAASAWQSFKDNMASKPPFSIAWGMGSFVIDTWDHFKGEWNYVKTHDVSDGRLCLNLDLDPDGQMPGQLSGWEHEACLDGPLVAMSQAPLVQTFRGLAAFAVVWFVCLRVWRILKSAFTDSPDIAAPTFDGDGYKEDRDDA